MARFFDPARAFQLDAPIVKEFIRMPLPTADVLLANKRVAGDVSLGPQCTVLMTRRGLRVSELFSSPASHAVWFDALGKLSSIER